MWHPYVPRGFDRKRASVIPPPLSKPLPKPLHGLQGNLRQTVSPTTATALIKALMTGFQPRWNLSSHIITRRQLALAELQPSGLQRTHSDHSSYSTSASSVVGLVLVNPATTTTSLRSWEKTSSAVLICVGYVICRLAQMAQFYFPFFRNGTNRRHFPPLRPNGCCNSCEMLAKKKNKKCEFLCGHTTIKENPEGTD